MQLRATDQSPTFPDICILDYSSPYLTVLYTLRMYVLYSVKPHPLTFQLLFRVGPLLCILVYLSHRHS